MQANQYIKLFKRGEMAIFKHDDWIFIEINLGINHLFYKVSSRISLVTTVLTQIIRMIVSAVLGRWWPHFRSLAYF
jgi:hypothetical protein